MSTADQSFENDLALEDVRLELEPPKMYKVMLLNDDYTPMEFVIEVLRQHFSMNEDKATQVMLHVHTKGKAVCGIFTKEIAETKVAHVNDFSRKESQPLQCTLEAV
ncbi:MAG: ATP-dependent Clp protease adapter ClpS [Proteobacteria bacterium]|nr:ATP-dependent Clp protease adapter ClpS [Pseudomonadota bacterium]